MTMKGSDSLTCTHLFVLDRIVRVDASTMAQTEAMFPLFYCRLLFCLAVGHYAWVVGHLIDEGEVAKV